MSGGFLQNRSGAGMKKVKKHLDKYAAHAYNVIWLEGANQFFGLLVRRS